jgi:triosephosphate isomerase
MSKLIVLNHKMNMMYDDVYSYINEVNKINTDNSIVVVPSDIYLEAFVNNCAWGVGCQNLYYEIEGDYTGEVSTNQLRSLGVEYALVGHYERRKYFKETLEESRKKLEACLEANIMPILCLGEEEGEEAEVVIKKQLDILLKNIGHIEFITFAYEPGKAITSGEAYDCQKIEEVVKYIDNYLQDKYGVKPNIIYGGGVKQKNVKNILQIEGLSGIIIGTSSIDVSLITEFISSI